MRENALVLRSASERAERMMLVVRDLKTKAGLATKDLRAPEAMLGEEWSPFTTTLGSREAKELAANPHYAAVVLQMMIDAETRPGDTVAVNISGSFPSLAISTLAALEEYGAEYLLVSSIGASSFGANQPMATWADMEERLYRGGMIRHRSRFLTFGGDDDNGGGIDDEGKKMIRQAAMRNGMIVEVPGSLDDAIALRETLFVNAGARLLINIGGNHAALGNCGHAERFPNGLQLAYAACADEQRGLLQRMAGRGLPVVHLLNIRDLSARYRLSADTRWESQGIYYEKRPVLAVLIPLLIIVAGTVGAVSRLPLKRSEPRA